MIRYAYDVEMKYISSKNKEYPILPATIQDIVVTHDFDNALMPTIAVVINLEAEIFDRMKEDQGKGMVYLNIKKFKTNGTSSAKVSYFADQFNYLMNDNPNDTKQFDKHVKGMGIAYKVCTLGLTKNNLISMNKRQFNGIMTATNMATLVQNGVNEMPIVLEPLRFNTEINTITIPPINTVVQYLAYLNDQHTFYGDQYLFFMDFDTCYLKSNSGKFIDAKDGDYPYIAIDIRKMHDYKALTSGIVVDDSQMSYIAYIDSANAEIKPDRITPLQASSVVSIDSDGKSQNVKIDTSAIVNTAPNPSVVYVNSDDKNKAQYVASSLQSGTVMIVVTKTEMDAAIFTPNKEYMISNYEGYNQYTGRYYLAFKKELFHNQGTQFINATTLGLRMVVHY